jgi:hypothetical protein
MKRRKNFMVGNQLEKLEREDGKTFVMLMHVANKRTRA